LKTVNFHNRLIWDAILAIVKSQKRNYSSFAPKWRKAAPVLPFHDSPILSDAAFRLTPNSIAGKLPTATGSLGSLATVH
jgi:hypothetical protein